MMWWHEPGMTTWGYALTTVGMVLFWQLTVFGMIVLIRHLGRLNHSVAERPVPRSHLPSGSPAAGSTSTNTESVWTRCEDCSQPAARSRRRTLRPVSPV
jgi:hypothetical protein